MLGVEETSCCCQIIESILLHNAYDQIIDNGHGLGLKSVIHSWGILA